MVELGSAASSRGTESEEEHAPEPDDGGDGSTDDGDEGAVDPKRRASESRVVNAVAAADVARSCAGERDDEVPEEDGADGCAGRQPCGYGRRGDLVLTARREQRGASMMACELRTGRRGGKEGEGEGEGEERGQCGCST